MSRPEGSTACSCDPEAYDLGPEGQRRYFPDRGCPQHGDQEWIAAQQKATPTPGQDDPVANAAKMSSEPYWDGNLLPPRDLGEPDCRCTSGMHTCAPRSPDELPAPEWCVREYEELRDDYLTLRTAIIEARRELWWFIENDEPSGEAAARAIYIQDEILGRALRGR